MYLTKMQGSGYGRTTDEGRTGLVVHAGTSTCEYDHAPNVLLH